jgi:hypothetical protein
MSDKVVRGGLPVGARDEHRFPAIYPSETPQKLRRELQRDFARDIAASIRGDGPDSKRTTLSNPKRHEKAQINDPHV